MGEIGKACCPISGWYNIGDISYTGKSEYLVTDGDGDADVLVEIASLLVDRCFGDGHWW